jgi:putative ABC transport system permease protein
MSIRALQVELTAHHNQLLWFCSNGQPLEMSQLALAIAATGLSGVTALMVSQRTREIGIRMALGAQSNEVLRMVMVQGMSVIVFGLAVGIVSALAFSRVMKALLFETTVNDPLTFAGVALLFLAVGLAASYVPARRVTKVDPLIALRSE